MSAGRAGILILVVALIPTSHALAAAPQVGVAVVGAAGVAPASFADGSKPGIGVAGGARWRLGSRQHLGLEAEYVQFAPESRGEDGLGGTRRMSSVTVPLAWRLNSEAARTSFELVAAVGYGHESIEAVSGGTAPGRATRRDGVAWGAGFALTHPLWGVTSLWVDLRGEGLSGGGESTRQSALRVGLRAAAPQR